MLGRAVRPFALGLVYGETDARSSSLDNRECRLPWWLSRDKGSGFSTFFLLGPFASAAERSHPQDVGLRRNLASPLAGAVLGLVRLLRAGLPLSSRSLLLKAPQVPIVPVLTLIMTWATLDKSGL